MLLFSSRYLLLPLVISSFLALPAIADDDVSVFDLVTECDLLAAHPDDPMRMADGVTDDDIVPRLALQACEEALDEQSDARVLFQLGRISLALKNYDTAMGYFNDAASQNYAAAHAYIGDMHQFGLGVTANAENALQHYNKAVSLGFHAAKDQVKQVQFDKSLYVSTELHALYEGNSTIVKSSTDLPFKNYLFNFITSTMDSCSSYLTPGSLVNFYLYRYPPGEFSIEKEENINVAIQTDVGEHDAAIFLERHGCEGVVATTLFSNINTFFKSY